MVLLFSIILLVACGNSTDSSTQATQNKDITPASDYKEDDTTKPYTETSGTATPNTSGGFDCANVKQIPLIECAALVALYTNTNGPSWVDNNGWLVSNVPCTWSGIDCAGGHISYMSLAYNQLIGILPPELGNLSQLHALGLSSNRLYGPIPAELGNLSELVALEMSSNQLTGPVPAELGNLSKLRTLSLGNNKLSESIPLELGNIGKLQSLVLSRNQLSGTIPASLGRLSLLSELDLSYNQLSGPLPEFIAQISGSSLWGNQLNGTITANGHVPFTVDYKGVHFSADPTLANGIWPEVKSATPLPEDQEGPSYWLAIPEHIRFTFADPGLSPMRRRMGFNLAVEAQILVFPLAELVDINPLVQTQIETLRNLLAERGKVPSGELPLLPLTNSAQVFHSQAQYLVSSNIQGLRFISQHSQDPAPIILSQELFYTFQGFTADGAYYVAVFFPLTTAVLPDTIEVDDWETFHANYDTYLAETTTLLDQLLPAEFTPDLTLLDAVIISLGVEDDR
jgi:hypothetical protein